VRVVVAVSDDADASERIAAFAASDDPWLVAVRMVSEGVDIPRLRVGVYATTTTTELFFRQAVGRLVRWTPGVPGQRSYLYIPDDARLRGWAQRIAEVRRHSLRRDTRERPEADPAQLDALRDEPARDGEQLSLFAVISAVATDVDDPTGGPPGGSDGEPDDGAVDDDTDSEDTDSEELLLTLPSLAGPRAVGARGAAFGGAGNLDGRGVLPTRREHKARLRDANARVARDIARRTGWSHAQVNAELNRLAGVRRIPEATVEQLQRRLRQAEAWCSRT
jgi:hypothetical protein